MFPRRDYFSFFKDPVWTKILVFSLILFFIRLSDSIIAFWAPNQIQNTLGDPVIMGAIISLQSVVGLGADLIFPRLLRSIKVRRLVFWAILTSALTSLFLTASIFQPFILIFVVTMIVWGIYYELINFANFQFMGTVVPLTIRAGAWGFSGIFLSLAYFLGPFVATSLLSHGVLITQGTIIIFLLTSFVLLTLTKNMHDAPAEIDFTDLNPVSEAKHWLSLSEHIWPILVISLVLGFVDATFYTVGAVWTEKLSLISPWGAWFLPLYLLPFICLGVPLSRWKIASGKKKLAEIFLGVSGLIFIAIAFSQSVPWQLLVVGLASSALAVTYPLLEAVYSDVISRMGRQKKDMIGLTNSVTNVSYIIWPIFAGIITSKVGERMTFSYLGTGVFAVAAILLIVTPRKLRLPQEEIQKWQEEK